MADRGVPGLGLWLGSPPPGHTSVGAPPPPPSRLPHSCPAPLSSPPHVDSLEGGRCGIIQHFPLPFQGEGGRSDGRKPEGAAASPASAAPASPASPSSASCSGKNGASGSSSSTGGFGGRRRWGGRACGGVGGAGGGGARPCTEERGGGKASQMRRTEVGKKVCFGPLQLPSEGYSSCNVIRYATHHSHFLSRERKNVSKRAISKYQMKTGKK